MRNHSIWSSRQAILLKMFMLSFVLLGMILGAHGAEFLLPRMGILWICFLITATMVLTQSRIRKRRTIDFNYCGTTQLKVPGDSTELKEANTSDPENIVRV